MRLPRSTSRSARRTAFAFVAVAALLALLFVPRGARAQACCAGGSAVTPGRLEVHEDALVGVQLRAAVNIGSYDRTGSFVRVPAGTSETDLEQDLFAAARFLRRAQAALLVPFVETQRSDSLDGSHVGGGIGDVNLSARYDFVLAGESLYVPGIALLAGITAPTGRTPEDGGGGPNGVDATGIGAWQANLALAFEQTFGPWLVNATGIVAKRTPRFGETLGTQGTLLLAGAYTFDNDVAVVLSASYTFEGSATSSQGSDVLDSSKRVTAITLSGLWPLSDAWRVLGGFVLDPPLGRLGSNQPATAGFTLTLIRSWS